MKRNIPIIIFGDYIAAFGAIRCLHDLGMPIFIVSKSGAGVATKSKHVNGSLKLPPHAPDFFPKLNGWFEAEVGGEAVLMVAGDDDYLDLLSQNFSKLRDGMMPTFPSWEIAKLVREKRYTYEIASRLGIPVPKTQHVACRKDLEKIVKNDEELSFPILMKPEDSGVFLKQYGNKGIVVHSVDELLPNYDKHGGFHGSLLLQDLIPGEESRLVSSLISLNKKSEPTGMFMSYKRRSEGQFLSCSLVATTWSDEVLEYSLKLLREIGYYGYAGTQFKLDPRDGKYRLMEINGRVTMSNCLGLKVDVNLPRQMYLEALSSDVPEMIEFEKNYDSEVLWWFAWADIYGFFRNRLYKHPIEFLRSLKGKGYTIEPLSLRDPLPGLWLLRSYIVRSLKSLFRLK